MLLHFFQHAYKYAINNLKLVCKTDYNSLSFLLDTYEKRRLYITVTLCTILTNTKVTNSKTNPQNVEELNFYVVDLIHYTDLLSRCFQVTNTTPCPCPRKDIDYFRFPSANKLENSWNKFQANWTEHSATIVITHTHSFMYRTVLIALNQLSTVNILGQNTT